LRERAGFNPDPAIPLTSTCQTPSC
jgi:hypothetical protein